MTAGGTKVVRIMCPMNCHPTSCGILVEVEGGRLKTVSGDKESPTVRASFACEAAALTRFSAIQVDCCTPKFAMIAARIPGVV
jgi:Molybdopterin oxidoreductase Fe4S4 domain